MCCLRYQLVSIMEELLYPKPKKRAASSLVRPTLCTETYRPTTHTARAATAVAVQPEQPNSDPFRFIYLLKFIQDKVEHKSSSRQGLNYWLVRIASSQPERASGEPGREFVSYRANKTRARPPRLFGCW